MTLYEALNLYGADATRFCLADAGDSVEDANFVSANADNAILRLFGYIEWASNFAANKFHYQKPAAKYKFQDKYFYK